MRINVRACFGKEPPYEQVVMLETITQTTVDDIQQAVKTHFQLGTCRVLGFPKPPKAVASVQSDRDPSSWRLAELYAEKLAASVSTPAIKLALTVVGQKVSLADLKAAEEAHLLVKLDAEARVKFYETRLREQMKAIEQTRDSNRESRNRISVKQLGAQSISRHQILTLNELCLTANYAEGEKHIRLSAALQHVMHEATDALRYCAMSGSLSLFRQLLEHSSRMASNKQRLVLNIWRSHQHYYGSHFGLWDTICRFGRVDFAIYALEERDAWEDYCAQGNLPHPPAVGTDEYERLNQEFQVKLTMLMQNGAKLAAEHCHLELVRYFMNALEKRKANTRDSLTQVALAATKAGDLWIVREALSKWPALSKDAAEATNVIQGWHGDVYACISAALASAQFAVFEMLVRVPGVELTQSRIEAYVRETVQARNVRALRYMVQVLHFTPEQLKLAVYETFTVSSAPPAASASASESDTDGQGVSQQQDVRLLVGSTLHMAIDHPETLECLLSDCRVLLTADEFGSWGEKPKYTSHASHWESYYKSTAERQKDAIRRAQLAREDREIRAAQLAGALSGRVADIERIQGGVVDDASVDEHRYVAGDEYLTYPIDIARLLAQKMTGTRGLHAKRFVQEGDIMLGNGWREPFRKKENDIALAHQARELERQQREAAAAARNMFVLA